MVRPLATSLDVWYWSSGQRPSAASSAPSNANQTNMSAIFGEASVHRRRAGAKNARCMRRSTFVSIPRARLATSGGAVKARSGGSPTRPVLGGKLQSAAKTCTYVSELSRSRQACNAKRGSSAWPHGTTQFATTPTRADTSRHPSVHAGPHAGAGASSNLRGVGPACHASWAWTDRPSCKDPGSAVYNPECK